MNGTLQKFCMLLRKIYSESRLACQLSCSLSLELALFQSSSFPVCFFITLDMNLKLFISNTQRSPARPYLVCQKGFLVGLLGFQMGRSPQSSFAPDKQKVVLPILKFGTPLNCIQKLLFIVETIPSWLPDVAYRLLYGMRLGKGLGHALQPVQLTCSNE